MTDKDIAECVKKAQTQIFKDVDYVGATKYYCRFLASGNKNFSLYHRHHEEGFFGYKNEKSFISGVPQLYRRLKKYLGRDFWPEVVKPELSGIVPPKPHTTPIKPGENFVYVMPEMKGVMDKLEQVIKILNKIVEVWAS